MSLLRNCSEIESSSTELPVQDATGSEPEVTGTVTPQSSESKESEWTNVDKSESHSQIQFERAYYSAKSKFPFFSDECNMKTEIQDQERDSAFNEILEKYKRTIKNEMLKDLANDETTSTSGYLDQLIIDRIKFDLNISKEL